MRMMERKKKISVTNEIRGLIVQIHLGSLFGKEFFFIY